MTDTLQDTTPTTSAPDSGEAHQQSDYTPHDTDTVGNFLHTIFSHKIVLSSLGLLVLTLGGAAALMLTASNQDTRQRAAETTNTCTGYFNVVANTDCAAWEPISDPMNRYSAKVGSGVVKAYQDWISPNGSQFSTAVWVNGKGWARNQNILASGLPDSSQALEWTGGAALADRLPGTGEPQGAGAATMPDGSLYQIILRNGVAYERFLPNVNGALSFTAPSATYQQLSNYLPEGCDASQLSDISLWESYTGGTQTGIGEALWCGDKGFYHTVELSDLGAGAAMSGTGRYQRNRTSNWQAAAGQFVYPGSGKIVGLSNIVMYRKDGSGLDINGKRETLYKYGAMERTVWRYDGTNEYAYFQFVPLNTDGTPNFTAVCAL